MPESNDVARRRLISGFCFAILALLFLSNPLTRMIARGPAATPGAIAAAGFLTVLSMVLMVGVVFGIVQLLRPHADRTALTGAALTIAGWTVGCRIIAVIQLETLLQIGVAGVPPDAFQRMLAASPIVWASLVPVGLMFPLGLVTLGVALFTFYPVNRWIGALLAIGGVLFPLGRAVRLEWAIWSSDLVLGVTFALLAWQAGVTHVTFRRAARLYP